MNQPEIILYDFANSPCSRRVKIALLEKGLSYQTQIVNLAAMEQKSAAYLKINPNGLVPAMAFDGHILYESSVMNDYIEDLCPSPALYPSNREEFTAVRYWQQLELHMAKAFRTLMYARTLGPMAQLAFGLQEFIDKAKAATDNAAHLAWEEKAWKLNILNLSEQDEHVTQLKDYADKVEQALEGKDFLVGNAFSHADIATYPRLTMFPTANVQLPQAQYPNIHRWSKTLAKRPSFANTQADQEKALLKLNKFGLLPLINRALYAGKNEQRLFDRLVLKIIKPVIRKKLNEAAGSHGNRAGFSPLEASVSPKPSGSPASIGRKTSLSQADIDAIKTGSAQLSLYGCSLCPLTQRLQTLLDLMALPYQYTEVSLLDKQHLQAEFLALNPCAELPVLAYQASSNKPPNIISDSYNIAEFIAGHTSPLRWFPADADTAAEHRLWNAFDQNLHKEYMPFFWAELAQQYQRQDPRGRHTLYTEDQAKLIIREKMSILNAALSKRSWLAGDAFSYADVLMLSRINSFTALGIDDCLDQLDALLDWQQRGNLQLATCSSQAQEKLNDEQ